MHCCDNVTKSACYSWLCFWMSIIQEHLYTVHWILIPWVNIKQCQTLTNTATQYAKLFPKFKKSELTGSSHIVQTEMLCKPLQLISAPAVEQLYTFASEERRLWKMKFLLLLALACLVSAAEEPLPVYGWALRELCRKIGGCGEFIIVWHDIQCDSKNILVPFWVLNLEYVTCLKSLFVLV